MPIASSPSGEGAPRASFVPDYDPADAVAVVAMEGRFPGADSVESFWQLVQGSEDSIRRFSREQLLAAGFDPELVDDPRFVAARGVLDGVEDFDAELFSIVPREAALIDPQHRIFLELAWRVLERAGWDPRRAEDSGAGRVGVFAGTTGSSYLLHHLYASQQALAPGERWQAGVLNQKSALPTRVSYKLGLSGPSLAVASACSSSLLAVHMGCQSLLDYHCDTALAGGVTVRLPQVSGQLHLPGGIHSADGRCRPYASDAAGTVFGDGAGILVLRRLEDALADGDKVHAVIRGSACNNDGSQKAGFTAPGVDGQEAVIRRALDMAEVDAATIGLVEGHGTATALGDPIEVRALNNAFRASSDQALAPQSCWLGSVKGHVGHLDAAAGVAGLIKAVLAVERGVLPPTCGYREANAEIDFSATPFVVGGEPRPWHSNGAPRRAGISAFGIGGTNVHLVLEEAPPEASGGGDRESPSGAHQSESEPTLLLLSARSEGGLEQSCEALGDALEAASAEASPLSLPDIGHTLAHGRHRFSHRRAVLVEDLESAPRQLRQAARSAPSPAVKRAAGQAPAVAFLLPGQGSQHPGMGQELWHRDEGFRRHLEELLATVRQHGGEDLEPLLFPEASERATAARALRRTENAQPALVAVELALAAWWEERGVRPAALLGHSVGEWSAACLAGVMSPTQTLRLVTVRGRLMAGVAPGAMLAVPLAVELVEELLASRGGDLDLAVINAADACVVSGPASGIVDLESELADRGVETRRLHTSHAFHSRSLDAILPAFEAEVSAAGALAPPRIPFVSNVSGTWILDEEATAASYWARQLRAPVRFGEGLETLCAAPPAGAGSRPVALLEVGPGRALTSLARRRPQSSPQSSTPAIPSWPHPRDAETVGADRALLEARGRLWSCGVESAVDGLFSAGRRVPLPPTPLEGSRHWIPAPSRRVAELAEGSRLPGLSDSLGSALSAALQRNAALRADDPLRKRVEEHLQRLVGELDQLLPAPVDADGTGETETTGATPADLSSALSAGLSAGQQGAEAEDAVQRALREVLGIGAVSEDDDFFELGGDSLLALRVAGRLSEELGRPVDAGDLFAAPRIADLRERLGVGESSVEGPTGPASGHSAAGEQSTTISRHDSADGTAPLTFAQRRLWVLDQLEPGNPAHHLPVAVKMQGPLAPRSLERALGAVVERHETLRTVFSAPSEGDGEPRQRALTAAPLALSLPLPTVDLGALGEQAGEELTLRLARTFLRRPFDLAAGPPLRALLLRQSESGEPGESGEHTLLLALHHIVADGLSLGRLLQDLAHFYAEESALPPLPLSYGDYAHWQRQRWEAGAYDEALEAWSVHLADLEGALELPADRPRPAVQRFDGARVPLSFGSELSGELLAAGKRQGVTPFALLWASFAATLARFAAPPSGDSAGDAGGVSREVVVGTPVSSRQQPELESLVGLFLETWVLRLPVDGDGSGSEVPGLEAPGLETLARRAQEELGGAIRRGTVPFERVVESLAPRRDLSRNPLFQILFAFLESSLEDFAAGDLTLSPQGVDPGTAQLDLTVNLVLRSGAEPRIEGWLELSTALFDAVSLQRFAAAWRSGLRAALADPGLDHRHWPLLSEAQHHQLVVEWAGPSAAAAGLDGEPAAIWGETLEPVIVTIARRATEIDPWAVLPADPGDDSALRARANLPSATRPLNGPLTYTGLMSAVAAVAKNLLLHSVDRLPALESPVLVALPPGGAAAAALLGIWRAGWVAVPVDPEHPAARLRAVLEDSEAQWVITSEALRDSMISALGFDGAVDSSRVLSIESLAGAAGAFMEVALPTPDPQRLAYVLYTSGSTGRPKGVAVNHRTLSRFLAAMAEGPGADLVASPAALLSGGQARARSMPTLTTLAFDISLLEHFLPLVLGAALRPVPRAVAKDGHLLAQWLDRAVPTAVQATPATWRMLLAAGWRGADDLILLCGGEALPRELAEELAGELAEGEASGQSREGTSSTAAPATSRRRLWNLYGPTETTVWSAAGVVSAPRGDEAVSLGDPLPATRLYVLDSRLQPVALGGVGELWIAGDGLARGYHRLPARTALAFRPNPFALSAGASGEPRFRGPGSRIYGTGDLVRRRHDGRLDFLGRRDFQVKVRGFRIELGEVERAVEALEGVRVAAVTARRDGAGHRLVAHVVAASGREIQPAELQRQLAGTLPGYMIPAVFDELEALPLGPSGKVNRRALGERVLAAAASGPRTPPATDAERSLADLWTQVLGREPAREDNFFALGGDSVASVRVVSLALAAGWQLSARDLFRSPVLADLARDLEARGMTDPGQREDAPLAVGENPGATPSSGSPSAAPLAAVAVGPSGEAESPDLDAAELDDFLEGL